MNKPCNKCIVDSMCMEVCPDLIDFMKVVVKSYNINIPYNNMANIDILRLLAKNVREKLDSDDNFYYLCLGLNNNLCRLYIEYDYGEIIKMRLSNESM